MELARGMRLFLFAHNSFAMGHVVRTCALARSLRMRDPACDIVIISGARFNFGHLIDPTIEVIKLPSYETSIVDGRYSMRAARLNMPVEQLARARQAVIHEVLQKLSPDVILVDQQPGGLMGELLEPLSAVLKRSDPPRLVLGTKSVIGTRDEAKEYLSQAPSWKALTELYDDILVYGDEQVADWLELTGVDKTQLPPVRHVGYVNPRECLPTFERQTAREELDVSDDQYVIVASVGGGKDGGETLLKALLAMQTLIEAGVPVRGYVVTGPYLPAADRSRLEELASNLKDIQIAGYAEHLWMLTCSADFVIARGGYNTLVEIMLANVPAAILPRTIPETEQEVHSRILERIGICRVVEETSSPQEIVDAVLESRGGSLIRKHEVNLNGASMVAKILLTNG